MDRDPGLRTMIQGMLMCAKPDEQGIFKACNFGSFGLWNIGVSDNSGYLIWGPNNEDPTI